jgi:hypothetical protein
MVETMTIGLDVAKPSRFSRFTAYRRMARLRSSGSSVALKYLLSSAGSQAALSALRPAAVRTSGPARSGPSAMTSD